MLLSSLLLGGCIGGGEKPEPVAVVEVEPEPSIAAHINEVSQMMADQLIRNTDITQFSQNPVAVTSFVNLENFEETSRLGEIIAENMIHELQVHGHKVIDYKVTPFIRVTPKGDFVKSREVEELVKRHKINVVLTGTYVVHNDGVMFNARMMEFDSGVVVSSAQGTVPGWTAYAVENRTAPMVEELVAATAEAPAPVAVAEIAPAAPAANAEGFSQELQTLDDILFSEEVMPVAAAVAPAAANSNAGRYICLKSGVCFERKEKKKDENKGAAL